jgi:hypothetical protein
LLFDGAGRFGGSRFSAQCPNFIVRRTTLTTSNVRILNIFPEELFY